MLATTKTIIRSIIGSIKLNTPNDIELFLLYYKTIKEKEYSDDTFTTLGQDKDLLL